MKDRIELLEKAVNSAEVLKDYWLDRLTNHLEEYENPKNKMDYEAAKDGIKECNTRISDLNKSITHLHNEINSLEYKLNKIKVDEALDKLKGC